MAQFQNNGKLKLLIIVGTRPEIIRLAAVINKCRQYFDCLLAHTGQNYDYSLNGVFFKDLKLKDPDVYLDAVGEDLGATMGNIIDKSYKLMVEVKPDAVLVLYNPRDLSAKPYFAFWNKGGNAGPPERTVLLDRGREVLEVRGNGTEGLSLGEGLFPPGDRLCLTVGSATAADGGGAWASVALVDAATGETFQQDGIACGVATPQRLLFFVPDREGDFRLVFRPGGDGSPRGGRIGLEGVSLERIAR